MSYTLIERKELTSAASSISFDNIPQFYSDLVILTSVRSAQDDIATEIFVAFNGSTSSFSSRQLFGSGSTVGSSTPARQTGLLPASQSTSNTFNNGTIYIPNYAGATNKSYSVDSVTENNATTAYQNLLAGLWSSTNAINSFTLTNTGGNNFAAGSSISLYGINRQQAIGMPRALGGQITFANNYWIHSFTGSGTFSPKENLDVETLVVAGGGGGGWLTGAGGGAGGYRTANLSVSAFTQYPITVGAGAAGAVSGSVTPDGFNSTFASITSTGGGGGGAHNATGATFYWPGRSGGSGGGSWNNVAGGTATPSGQGNNGGAGSAGPGYGEGGGGGGGAGAVGQNGAASNSGNGGAGLANFITGSLAFYAGGGGAANGSAGSTTRTTGGSGVGGSGGVSTSINGGDGVANTGGGGGGGGYSGQLAVIGTAGNGGSGIVIIRYKA